MVPPNPPDHQELKPPTVKPGQIQSISRISHLHSQATDPTDQSTQLGGLALQGDRHDGAAGRFGDLVHGRGGWGVLGRWVGGVKWVGLGW